MKYGTPDEQARLTDAYSDAVNEHHAAVKALGTLVAVGCGDFHQTLARAHEAVLKAELARLALQACRERKNLRPISMYAASSMAS